MPTPYDPSVDDVAALLQARLERRGGGKAQTFDDTTSPTGTQVGLLAGQAGRRVAASIGTELCPAAADLADDAIQAAAIYAAMLVEQSYFPEQTRNAGSSFQSLKSLWDDAIRTLTEAVGERCGSGDGGAVGGEGQRPRAWFDALPLIGRSSPDW